jgi:hypothetical protein
VHLQPGETSYILVYRTDRQIGYFDAFDELYWNVTGNGWDFPIETARAVVRLPAGAEVVQAAAYTGPAGAGGQDYTADSIDNGFEFKTTRPLKRHEGLTIAVAWPKGIVAAPDTSEKIGYLVDDNRGLVFGLGDFLVPTLQRGNPHPVR